MTRAVPIAGRNGSNADVFSRLPRCHLRRRCGLRVAPLGPLGLGGWCQRDDLSGTNLFTILRQIRPTQELRLHRPHDTLSLSLSLKSPDRFIIAFDYRGYID